MNSISSMRVSCTENVKHIRYNQFREYDYFKNLFKHTNDVQLKQILINYIHKIHTRTLDHQNYVYLSQKSVDEFQMGKQISKQVKTLNRKIHLLRIPKRIDEIITKLFFLNIPIIDKLKAQYKFDCLYFSDIIQYPFNRLIKKKGQNWDGILYIIEGQISLQKNGRRQKFINEGNFIGINSCIQNEKEWNYSIYSSKNETKIWIIYKEGLDIEIGSDEKTLKQKFIDFYFEQQNNMRQTYEKTKLSQIRERLQKINNEKKMRKKTQLSLNCFMKRCHDFKSSINVTNSAGFNEYINKKKIIVKLEQTMKISKNNLENMKKLKLQKAIKSRQNTFNCTSSSFRNFRVAKQTLMLNTCDTLNPYIQRPKTSNKTRSNPKQIILKKLSALQPYQHKQNTNLLVTIQSFQLTK